MSDLFDRFVPALLAREGGDYADRPADAGGPTRWGVTAHTLGAWRGLGRDAAPEEVRALEREEAVRLYRRLFYEEPGWDRVAAICPQVAEELTDTGVNMGPRTAGAFLQRALNVLNRGGADYPDVVVDGRAGPQTRAALAALIAKRGPQGIEVLLKALNGLQAARYIEIAERRAPDEQNCFGWLAQRVGLPG